MAKKSPSKKAATKKVAQKAAPAVKNEAPVLSPAEKAATRMPMAKPYRKPVKRNQ